MFGTLKLVERKVESVNISRGEETRLTLNASNDKNIYYQIYQGRFNDSRLNEILEGDAVSFYTTPQKFQLDKPILSKNKNKPFEYFPIFNVNSRKNLLDIFCYYLYGNSWFNIIFYLTSAATFFYLIPFVAVVKWPKKLILIFVAGIWVWLFLI